MQRNAAVKALLVELANFETVTVGSALQALSKYPSLSLRAPDALEFEAQLTLLGRLGFSRGVSTGLMHELELVLVRARSVYQLSHKIVDHLKIGERSAAEQTPHPTAANNNGNYTRVRQNDYLRLEALAELAPAVSQIERCTVAAIELQIALGKITARIAEELRAAESR